MCIRDSVWTEQVVEISEHRQLKSLEGQLRSAYTHLERGKINNVTCLKAWGPEDVNVGRALCASNQPDFLARWQATAEPVNSAHLSLRELCDTSSASAQPTTTTSTNQATSSPFPAGTTIGLAAKRDQITEENGQQDIHQLEKPQIWNTMSDDTISLTPQVFINTLTSQAYHDLAIAARSAAIVTQHAEYYGGGASTSLRMKKKHRKEMIQAIREKQPQPLSRRDMEDTMYNQLCGIQVTADRTRGQMTRTRCEELTLVETVTCILPEPLDLDNTDLPHPDLDNVFISPQGSDYLVHLWDFNSNPFHVTQPDHQHTSQERYKIVNRGRKIATRGRVSVTFGPTNQVLADKLTIHTRDGRNTGDIKVTCYQDGATTIVTGFIDLHNEESLTVGWNCELIGEEIWVPAVAK